MIGLMMVPAPIKVAGVSQRRTTDRRGAENAGSTGKRPADGRAEATNLRRPVAKDTEKLIRQLSLISFLMADGRPVSALEIKREVEGYSSMNEDAFARRFYADRAELESLGITLQVEKPSEGFFEAELYALPPENYYLPPDRVHRRRAGRAAHGARPAGRRVRLRRAVAARAPAGLVGAAQPAHRGRRRADRRPSRRPLLGPRGLAATGQDRDGDLAPQDDRVLLLLAPARRGLRPQGRPVPPRLPRRPVLFDRSLARARARFACSACRGSRARSPTRPRPSTTSRRPRTSTAATTPRAPSWQMGTIQGAAKVFLRERIAWLVERDYETYGTLRKAVEGRRRPGTRLDLRDRLRVRAPARVLGARLARERHPARSAGAGQGGRRAPGPAAQPPPRRVRRRRRRRPPARRRQRPRRARTAAPSRSSARSASRASSAWQAC